MIADSSVWVDFFAGRRHWQVSRWRDAIAGRTAMIVDTVRLEVLGGLAPTESSDRVVALLDACEDVMQLHRVDAEDAAGIYRACRRAGETVRALNDCLIAAIAIRNDVPVLHRDRDYDVIARHVPLRVVSQ